MTKVYDGKTNNVKISKEASCVSEQSTKPEPVNIELEIYNQKSARPNAPLGFATDVLTGGIIRPRAFY